jgi:hypothetical protein
MTSLKLLLTVRLRVAERSTYMEDSSIRFHGKGFLHRRSRGLNGFILLGVMVSFLFFYSFAIPLLNEVTVFCIFRNVSVRF